MEIKEKKTTGLKREFEITITNKTINELVQNKISELAPKASIPGFRPGKVPHNIIKSRFGKQIFGEVVNESLNKASKKIVDDFKINAATISFLPSLVFGINSLNLVAFIILPSVSLTFNERII